MKELLPTTLIATAFLCIGWAGLAQNAQAAELVTEKYSYSVKRSDSSEASTDKNEFYRGSHTYFGQFKDNQVSVWVDTKVGSFKSGWSRLYLDWPIRLSSITIHKAKAAKDDFKGGHVKLEIQSPKGKWTTVFERQDDDVDKAVTLKKEVSAVGLIKGVRISFRSPGPITIGPIELRK